MPIDFSREQPINVSVARKRHIPQIDGRPISPATAYRWIKRGVLAPDGKRVRLEAVKIGRSLVTTVEAVQRFLQDLECREGRHAETETAIAVETRAKLLAENLLLDTAAGTSKGGAA